jgi:hypothetical protein
MRAREETTMRTIWNGIVTIGSGLRTLGRGLRTLGRGTLATAVLVTVPLMALALQPVKIVEIDLAPSLIRSGHLPCTVATTRVRSGPAFFQFVVEGLAADVHKVRLHITPDGIKESFPQDDYPVQDGRASGRAQLASDQYPLSQDERYMFRLTDADSDATLMEGTVLVGVEELAGPAPSILALIGVLASVIQIVEAMRRRTPLPPDVHQTVSPV